ncbi:hypothetical protein NQ318_008392 [Aromia moschata]|uniref:Peptidase aspartic putative domain-containing protein n=1 Tax=Aromia moschata TaxID=1265417 RepID=A0AAV8YI75_9CUCU|nr:hypothetical protein NQ318_008392 [Aromia moschata]
MEDKHNKKRLWRIKGDYKMVQVQQKEDKDIRRCGAEANIARLVHLAYSFTLENVMNRLAVKAFLDGLRDNKICLLILAHPSNLVDAFLRGLELKPPNKAPGVKFDKRDKTCLTIKRCNGESNSVQEFKFQCGRERCVKRNMSSHNETNGSRVILSTVLVNILDKNKKLHTARALLDAGSQSNFITHELCEILQLKRTKINLKVCGLNQTHSDVRSSVSTQIQSRHGDFSTGLSCLVVPHISSDLPNFKINLQSLQIPNNITLADPKFHLPNKVDILLGAGVF